VLALPRQLLQPCGVARLLSVSQVGRLASR